jgi:hypothetical protein
MPTFLHELWRKHRLNDIHTITQSNPKAVENFLGLTTASAVATMLLYREPYYQCKAFHQETYEVLYKARGPEAVDDSLTATQLAHVEFASTKTLEAGMKIFRIRAAAN